MYALYVIFKIMQRATKNNQTSILSLIDFKSDQSNYKLK